jgi:neopullulanase
MSKLTRMSYAFNFLLLCFLSSVILAKDYSIQHLEPANWWVGMKYNKIELMVHGEKIGETIPRINFIGVELIEFKKADSPNYLFITLSITDNAKAGKFPIEFTVDNQVKSRFVFELLERKKDSAERKGFNASDAIYLITPDRFVNANPHNDSMSQLSEKLNREYKGGRHGGDIAGMIKHLDYIAAMGFTQIWPNPLVENNQEKYSYHGYSGTDLYKMDARYGTNEDFKKLVVQANKKGMGVIQDIVLNHIGSGHWWMKDLPMKDWLNFPEQYTETNHRRTVIQDPYVAEEDKEKFIGGWFVTTMPDLNQRNPHLAKYLIQNTLWWIEYAGLSGVREDTYGYAEEKFLTYWAKAVMEEYPNFNMVGEEWSTNHAVVAHWQRGKTNKSGHFPYMSSMMDFPMQDALKKALTEPEAMDTGLVRLYENEAMDFLYPDPFNLVVFADNHDLPRIYSVFNEDLDLYKMAMVYLATTRGIPQFYYGSEVLLTSPKERDDGAVRADMPGGWSGDKKSAFTQKGLSEKEIDAQIFLRKLLNWRKTAEVIHQGKLLHFAPQEGVYVYFRYLENKVVMVILNKNNQKTKLDLKRFEAVLSNKKYGVDVMSKHIISFKESLTLPARSSLIIELE